MSGVLTLLVQAILQPKQDAQSNACNRAERKAQPDRETDREDETVGCRPSHDDFDDARLNLPRPARPAQA